MILLALYFFIEFTKKVYPSGLIATFDIFDLLDKFSQNNFSFDGFMGKAHFRIKKWKRGKMYYNRCNCLPKRLRTIKAFREALLSGELIIVMNFSNDDLLLDAHGRVIGVSCTYCGSENEYSF